MCSENEQMTDICVLCLLTLSALWSSSGGDAEASCVFNKSCILPCSFQGDTDADIRWIHMITGKTLAHVYFNNHDQTYMDKYFTDRTSLFKDQISGGNASLQLTQVEVHDQGRYSCSISTISGNKDSFINLTVDAPVCEVNIQQVENNITCSSEGIYPQPQLTWSTSPPSNVTFRNSTTVQPTEEQLYNIRSCLILSDSVPDLDYSCTVSTRRNNRTVTWFKQKSQTGATGIIAAVVPVVILVVFLAGLLLYLYYRHKKVCDSNEPLSNDLQVAATDPHGPIEAERCQGRFFAPDQCC